MKLFFRLFDFTFGRVIRFIQRSLIKPRPRTGIREYVYQNAIVKSGEYALSNFSRSMMFEFREDLWNYSLQQIPELQTSSEIILEFGVYKGHSINYFAQKKPNSKVFGFDSFEGLEEDWYGSELPKGFFNLFGKLPRVENNVQLYKGWFDQTLPTFITDTLGNKNIHLLHIDCDTYKPTFFVINSLLGNLTRGSIIIFDEYIGYPGWELHEFKAFKEIVNLNKIKYRYIAYTETSVALQIL